MKIPARLVGVLVVGIGLVGIVMPDRLLSVGRLVATVPGLYAVAALRVGVGLVLVGAAGASRAPRTLRVLGGLVVIAGLVTPFFGVDRTRAIMDWATSGGGVVVRFVGAVLAVLGASLIYLVSNGARATARR